MRSTLENALRLALGAFLFCLPASVAAQKPPPKKQAPAKDQHTPGPLETLMRQAEQALEKEDFAAAAQAIEKYLQDRPEDPYAHSQLGYAYTGLHRDADARTEYEKAIALEPKLAAAHLNLGLLLLDKDPAAAAEPLRKAAELMPDQAKPSFLLGIAYERSGNAAAAIQSYQAAGRLDDKSFDIHFALGRVLLASRHAAEAEKEFREAVVLRQDSAPARVGLAESLVAQQKLEEAANEYGAYLELKPEDYETRYQLAAAFADLGKDGAALEQLDRAEADGLRSSAAQRLRIELYLRQQKFAEAGNSLEKALAEYPDDAELRAILGRVRLEQRDFPAAEGELLAALRLRPTLTDALRDLVAVFYLSENYPAALQALEKLSERETLSAGSWFVRATSYDKLQRKPEALAAYKMFVSLDQGRSQKQDFQARQRIRVLTRELERNR